MLIEIEIWQKYSVVYDVSLQWVICFCSRTATCLMFWFFNLLLEFSNLQYKNTLYLPYIYYISHNYLIMSITHLFYTLFHIVNYSIVVLEIDCHTQMPLHILEREGPSMKNLRKRLVLLVWASQVISLWVWFS